MERQTVLKTAGGKTLTGSVTKSDFVPATPVPSANFEKAMLKILSIFEHPEFDDFVKKVPRITDQELKLWIKTGTRYASETKTDDSILTETGAQCRKTKPKAQKQRQRK